LNLQQFIASSASSLEQAWNQNIVRFVLYQSKVNFCNAGGKNPLEFLILIRDQKKFAFGDSVQQVLG
jgi:hypothetical protein